MEAVRVIVQIVLFLIPLGMGARYGPMALIGTSGVSVFILVEVLRMQPGSPPLSAIFIILSVISATAALTAAGGMDFLVRLAGRAMRRHPGAIPVVGPLFVWLFTVMSGTGNITFALIPIMYDVSYSAKIRPARILATANAVCQLALMASPVAAVTYVFVNMTESDGNTLAKTLMVTVPASLVATVGTSLIMSRYGKDLDDDPEYQRRLAAGEIEPPQPVGDDADLPPLRPRAAISAYVFLAGVVTGVVLGFFSSLRPTYSVPQDDGSLLDNTVSMSFMIPIIMFAAAGIIMVVCKIKTPAVMSEPIIGTGLIAALLLLAVPVLAGTILNDHMDAVSSFVNSTIGVSVMLFAVILFLLASLIQSQVASLSILVPVAMTAGLGVGPMAGMLGAASGNNLLASMGGLGQACILTDKTGSTKQGSFLINSSFFVPMICSVIIAVAAGLGLQLVVY
ncbi:anaerobic C4-dicarboxylate transporter family protein [Gordonia humi]|uniref:Anaerobic C4-dicarboxylate transporter DcuA/anaerobic C4-dicarboxylate transporter DcuB n=1 Tax=Gordonia humi TaxID=686429 RepID=A0A840F5C2_9ACTN|nr:anaerobic C4-dicarboxylate transporter family protein [Gordonia humi]MBB4136689.1 anaerobic C4-dicarboxylate transporter DcuA/anaerobic C4-dicarboxylate transporter DcuB [Gordonia humi]